MLDAWGSRMAALDAAVEPLGRRHVQLPVDPSTYVRPLDELGLRGEALALVAELADSYVAADDEVRRSIRELFKTHEYFNWAAHPADPVATKRDLRVALVRFSMADQMPDPRDASMILYDIRQEASAAGLDDVPLLNEIAAISSVQEPWPGWPSTRDVLLAASRTSAST